MQANLLIVVEEMTKAMEERINGLDWLDAPKERALYILLDLTSQAWLSKKTMLLGKSVIIWWLFSQLC